MNNFDLRKYLAEGRLKVNEGDMDHLMQDLERELKQHDWFYYMADDPRSYDKGTNEQRELKRLLKMLNNSPEAIALYNKYAPVQGGIDLRIKEEKKGKDHDGDGDIDSDDYLMARDKAIKANLKEWGGSDWHYFLDAMHTDLGKPADAPDIFKVLDVAGDAVDKYWDDWEEYETNRQGLNMHAAQTYLKNKFPEYFKGMQALFAPMNETIDEEYNVGKGMEKDHDFDAMLTHALKLHAGTSIEDLKKVSNDFEAVNYHRENAYLEDAIDMLAAGKHEEFQDSLKLFKDEVKKTIRSFNESIEEDHDPDQEQLDDEDEIFMPMDDEGKPLEEAISQQVVNKVSRFITSMANYYDYSEQDAVYAIMQALKAHKGNFRGLNGDMMQEDMDLGHQDNEPGMLKGDLYKIGKYSMELYQMMDDLEDIDGEVDLPHWWQSKVTTAKNMISGAKHYLEFELKEPAIDAMVTEDSLEDQAKVYFMQKVKRGEIDELPEDPKAAFLAQMTKDQMDHDRETLDREGGLGEASFYTKNVKDKVISKLMDQLKSSCFLLKKFVSLGNKRYGI